MELQLNAEKLNEILSAFYEINGIRIVIFDASYNEVMQYPPEKCDFCKSVRTDPCLNELCNKNDIESFEHCKKSGDIYIYKCHAGLVEATLPLMHDQKIIGYMMLGQITDIKNKTTLEEIIITFNEKHGLHCDQTGIKFRSRKQIEAAAKILKICAEYIMLKELIEPKNERIVTSAKAYIKSHLSTQINVEDICSECGCSRTKLYEMFRADCGIGVAHYIMDERLKQAKNLLKTTELPITEISSRCGFCDYNYFGRVYKKHYGISPRKERERKR